MNRGTEHGPQNVPLHTTLALLPVMLMKQLLRGTHGPVLRDEPLGLLEELRTGLREEFTALVKQSRWGPAVIHWEYPNGSPAGDCERAYSVMGVGRPDRRPEALQESAIEGKADESFDRPVASPLSCRSPSGPIRLGIRV